MNATRKGDPGRKATNKSAGTPAITEPKKTAQRAGKQHSSACLLADVPPFSFMKPGTSAAEAAIDAARELRIPLQLEVIALRWRLQRMAAEDTAYKTAAEERSANATSKRQTRASDGVHSRAGSHKPTPKRAASSGVRRTSAAPTRTGHLITNRPNRAKL